MINASLIRLIFLILLIFFILLILFILIFGFRLRILRQKLRRSLALSPL